VRRAVAGQQRCLVAVVLADLGVDDEDAGEDEGELLGAHPVNLELIF
jgi:hypothetical protein